MLVYLRKPLQSVMKYSYHACEKHDTKQEKKNEAATTRNKLATCGVIGIQVKKKEEEKIHAHAKKKKKKKKKPEHEYRGKENSISQLFAPISQFKGA